MVGGKLMNMLQIFCKNEFSKIEDLSSQKPNSVMGVIYAIEYDDKYCKIGMSSNPSNRISTLKHYISDYMQLSISRIMISKWHTNYQENEKIIHDYFSDRRVKNTELFSISIDEIVEFINKGNLIFEDESDEILDNIEHNTESLIQLSKSLMKGNYDPISQHETQKAVSEYEKMLRYEGALTKTVVDMTTEIINNYEIELLLNVRNEINRLQMCFLEKWVEFGIIDKEDLII